MAEDKVRFASDAWLAQMQRILGELAQEAGPALDGVKASICEIATNAPADLADPARGDGSLAWHIVIENGNARAARGEKADADLKVRFDYQAILTLARWVYKDDPEDQAAVAKAREAIEKGGQFRSTGAMPALPPKVGAMFSELHNGLARITA
jgi:hypothetical protein